MLKVRIPSCNRAAVRNLGIDWSVAGSNFMVSQMFGNGGSLTALLDNNDVRLIVQATSSNNYAKVLAEPNLITLNGQTATFISGGQFAIPTAVGIGGIAPRAPASKATARSCCSPPRLWTKIGSGCRSFRPTASWIKPTV